MNIMTPEEIGEIFSEATFMKSGIGSPQMQCCCGKTHFAYHSEYFSEGELEELQKLRKEKPDDYIEDFNSDAISGVQFNGKLFVRGCPCGWESRSAQVIWNEREVIVKFLKDMKNKILLEAIEADNLIDL